MGKIFIGNKIIPKNSIKELIKCCSCQKYYNFEGNLFLSIKEKILVCPHCGLKHKADFTLINNKIDDLVKINKLDLTVIDIGTPAIDREYEYDYNDTLIIKDNPANASGKITSIEVWAFADFSNFEVATFYSTGANRFSTRDTYMIGSVTAGSKQTFPVDLTVKEGDYLGFYATAGYIVMDKTGGTGYWYYEADKIPCTDTLFVFTANPTRIASLYGTGETVLIYLISTSAIKVGTVSALSRGITEHLSSTANIASSITGRLTRIINLASVSAIATSITSVLGRGITETLTSTSNITTSITGNLSRGVKETLTSTSNSIVSITSNLSRGIKEALTSTANIVSSFIANLSGGVSWFPGWSKRIKITVDENDIGSGLSNFPTLVKLSASSGYNSVDVSCVFDELESNDNRKKIVITLDDGITQCYVEIERWDHANEKAWLWVKIPSVASEVGTELYLYYDKTKSDNETYVGDPNSTPAENVWDSNFKFVSHMLDDPDVDHIRDSTSNNNDATKQIPKSNEVDGKIDRAQEFETTDIEAPDDDSLDFGEGDFTVEAWMFIPSTNTGNNAGLRKKASNGSNVIGYGWFMNDGYGVGKMYFTYSAGAGRAISPLSVAIHDDSWHKIVGVRDTVGGKLRLYLDGAVDNTVNDVVGSVSNDRVLELGMGQARLIGKMDEPRISAGARSPAWIKASYESERDHLLDFGSEEVKIFLTSTAIIATSIISTLSRGVTNTLNSTSAIMTSTTSALSRGIKEVLNSTVVITTSTTAALSRGIKQSLTSISAITTSITSSLSRGIKEVLNTTVNITTSTVSALSRGITQSLASTVNIVSSIVATLTAKYTIIWIKVKKETTDFTKVEKEESNPTKIEKEASDWTKMNKEKGDWEKIEKE